MITASIRRVVEAIQWGEIPGYEGIYEISTYGNIMRDGKLLAPLLTTSEGSRNGYYRVGLYSNSDRKFYRVCRLVALTFIPNPDNKPEVNHKDGNSLNDEAFNLEWVTSSENKYHSHSSRIYGGDRIWKSQFAFLHVSGHTFRGSPAELKNTFMFEEDSYLLITDDITCAGWRVDWNATAALKHSERVNIP